MGIHGTKFRNDNYSLQFPSVFVGALEKNSKLEKKRLSKARALEDGEKHQEKVEAVPGPFRVPKEEAPVHHQFQAHFQDITRG